MEPRISVVLPVYEEGENIGRCLRGLWQALSGTEHEILVCYDRAEDGTLAAIAAMDDRPPTVRLVANALGRGAANAIRSGFRAATGDVVVTTMADLSDPPEVIPRMAERIRAGAAVVSGSRYMRGGSQEGGPRLKSWLSRAAGLSLSWLAGMGTHDATTNFRAYSAEFLRRVEIESDQGFEIALELTARAHLGGERVEEVPTAWRDRTAGKSRFRLWKWLPLYGSWYARVLAAPLLVWGAWALGTLLGLGLGGGVGPPYVADALHLGLRSAGACLLILAARRARGRMVFADAGLALLLLLHRGRAGDLASGVPVARTTAGFAVVLVVLVVLVIVLLSGARRDLGDGRVVALGVVLAALILLEPSGLVFAAVLAAWLARVALRRRLRPDDRGRSGLAPTVCSLALSVLVVAGVLGQRDMRVHATDVEWSAVLPGALGFLAASLGEPGRAAGALAGTWVLALVSAAALALGSSLRHPPFERDRAEGLLAALAAFAAVALAAGWGIAALGGGHASAPALDAALAAPVLAVAYLAGCRPPARRLGSLVQHAISASVLAAWLLDLV